jgi:hypothetical protein
MMKRKVMMNWKSSMEKEERAEEEKEEGET